MQPLWYPQLLHARYNIQEFSPELVTTLTKFHLGNDAVSHLDYLICREGKTPLNAADLWLKQNGM